jgi:hypothetical protein
MNSVVTILLFITWLTRFQYAVNYAQRVVNELQHLVISISHLLNVINHI